MGYGDRPTESEVTLGLDEFVKADRQGCRDARIDSELDDIYRRDPVRAMLAQKSSFLKDARYRALRKDLAEIYQLVLNAYFSGVVPPHVLRNLNPDRLADGWSPLASWSLRAETDLAPNVVSVYTERGLSDLALVMPATFAPSASCRDYTAALESGELDGYLGASGLPEKGVKGGVSIQTEKGVKGAVVVHPEKGVKGAINVRPEKGVKGSVGVQTEKGVKGEISTLRFCVDFEHKL
jgi:hypothetical protein